MRVVLISKGSFNTVEYKDVSRINFLNGVCEITNPQGTFSYLAADYSISILH